MKIFHISDLHLGEFPGPVFEGENGRLIEIEKALHCIVDNAEIETPELTIISGDVFHKSKVWADTLLKQISIFDRFIDRLRMYSENIIVLFGTANHDNMKAFELLRNKYSSTNVRFVTEPDVIAYPGVQVACVPGLDKRTFREQMSGLDVVDENKYISDRLGDIVKGLGAKMSSNGIKILTAHYSVVGAQYDNGGHVFHNSEVLLSSADIDAGGFDLVCLGHIHGVQKVEGVNTPTFYAGSIHRLNFNEEDQPKGFIIHEIDSLGLKSEAFEVPALKMKTIRLKQRDIEYLINHESDDLNNICKTETVKNKIVRVLYECDSEVEKRFNKKSLEEDLYNLGAYHVQEIRPERINQVINHEALNENGSILDNLRKYLEDKELPRSISIEDIITTAEPVISEIEASMSNARAHGLFRPLNLEVKNYRKYKEQTFDFTKVKFATVSGKNGIGKSSLFMDSIVDCLYEEPREGELTGWISSRVEARSGMIAFSFAIGEDTYRVVRTRTKSGKGTLSLQKLVEDNWKDISENKTADTQKKIIDVLGMDSRTFKVCVLIMQDNYGLFLEADKTERMKILSRILGLEIYEKLEKRFDDLRKENKRSVQDQKDKIGEIDTKMSCYKNLDNDIEFLEKKRDEVDGEIKAYKAEIADIESAWNNSKLLRDNLESVENRLHSTNYKLDNKVVDFHRTVEDIADLEKILDRKGCISINAGIWERYQEQKKQYDNKKCERNRISLDINTTYDEIERLGTKITEKTNKISNIRTNLDKKEELESKAKGLEELKEQVIKYEELRTAADKIDGIRKELRTDKICDDAGFNGKMGAYKNKLQELKNKTQLMKNANCLDIENAHCRFLEDAQIAKAEIPKMEEYINKLQLEIDAKAKEYNAKFEEIEREYLETSSKLREYNIVSIKAEIRGKETATYELAKLEGEELLLISEQEMLESYIEQKQGAIKKVQELIRQETELTKEIEILKTARPDDEYETDYNTFKKLPVLEERYSTQQQTRTRLESEIEELRTENDKLAGERETIKARLSETDFESLERKISSIKSQLRIFENQKSDVIMKLGAKQKEIETRDELQEERKQFNQELLISNKNREIYKFLRVAMSIDGIPFMIVRGVIDTLSSIANDILGQMTGGKMAIEMRTEKVLKSNKKKEINALEVWVNEYMTGSLPYLSRSGGERVKAALAVAFALAELNAMRAGIQIGMMFVDEPPFLDSEGVQAYCDALETLADKISSVLAISHDPSMKARFDQEINVVETSEGSKVVFE